MHLRYAVHRQQLRDEIVGMRLELYGPEGTEPGTGSYRCEFKVPFQHVRRSLGENRANLARARAVPGIIRIILDSNSGSYSIIAHDEAAMKEARG